MIRDRETLNQLLALIDRFVTERLIPRESELAESGSLPEDILDEMKAMGLFGLTIPEEYGGSRPDYGRRNRGGNFLR